LFERVAAFLYPVSVQRLVLKTWYSEPVVQTWDSEPIQQPSPVRQQQHLRQNSVICETGRKDREHVPSPLRHMANAYPSPPTEQEAFLLPNIDPALLDKGVASQHQPQVALGLPSPGTETDVPLSLIDPALENWNIEAQNQTQFAFGLASPGTDRDIGCLDEWTRPDS
jgi:hypothetical protein